MRLDDGRVLLRIHGTLFKTADGADGEPAEWVAGWDEPGNPVHDAIDILERLALAEKVTALFPRLHATRLHAPGKNNDNSMSHRAMGADDSKIRHLCQCRGRLAFRDASVSQDIRAVCRAFAHGCDARADAPLQAR